MQKELRLRKNEEFQYVFRGGKSAANHQFVVYYKVNPGTERIRLGVSASKKIGTAVVRNRMKRMIKEIVRHLVPTMEHGYDLIVIVRKPAVDMEFEDMRKSIIHVMKRAGVLQPSKPGTKRM